MKSKKIIKKIMAISTGMGMLSASMVGALALDSLSSYPSMFITNGVFNGAVVIGEKAQASDTVAQSVLLANLQTKAVSQVTNEVNSNLEGKSEEIFLGSNLTNKFDTLITDSTIKSLIDDTVNFKSSDYDVEEVIKLGSGLKVETSLTSSEDDYLTDVVLEIDRDSIKYFYGFSENIDVSQATTAAPLKIKFLDKEISITDTSSATKFTANVGAEYFLNSGDSVAVNEKTIQLSRVGSGGGIVVIVDGVTATISSSSTKTVNGIEIKNDETFYDSNNQKASAATLIIGKDALETYDSGDAFIGEDENDPNWVWVIKNLETSASTDFSAETGPIIGIENDFIMNDQSDNPPKAGDCVSLPNNYVKICLDGLNVDNYKEYTIEYENSADLSNVDSTLTSAQTVFIKTTENEGLVIGSAKTKEAWLYGYNETSMGVFYKDKDNNKVKLSEFVENNTETSIGNINFGNTKDSDLKFYATFSPSTNELSLTLKEGISEIENDDLTSVWGLSNNKIKSLGATVSSEEASELVWGTTTIGTKDEDHRTKYGVTINNPKSNGNADRVEFSVPEDTVKAIVTIGKPMVSGTSSNEDGPVTVNPITSSSILLDAEVINPGAQNLILVGGPAVNSLVGDIFGLVAEDFTPNEAMIKLAKNGNNIAMLVAGYNAIDTRNAAEAIVMGKLKNVKTSEAKVLSPSQKLREYSVVDGTTES